MESGTWIRLDSDENRQVLSAELYDLLFQLDRLVGSCIGLLHLVIKSRPASGDVPHPQTVYYGKNMHRTEQDTSKK